MILDVAREQVLERGVGLDEAQTLEVLRLPDDRVDDVLALAHAVRMRWCGPEVEVEGIVSIKTGGCPEDCHFCSQSGRFETPVRAVRLDIPSLVEAARETAATGATEFCIVAAVRGPDERLMDQVREGVAAITEAVEINVACSLGILTREQGLELASWGVHRYNHNLETARSYFPSVVTTHSWEERMQTLELVRMHGMEVCCGGIVGMGETREDRVGFIHTLATLPQHPESVPVNALVPVKGTVLGDMLADTPLAKIDDIEFVRTVAAARVTMPRSMVRLSAGRESMGEATQALCFMAGANSIFTGDKLLTAPNAGDDADGALFAKLGLVPLAGEEPMRACKVADAAE
jgi:biotin synthase